METAEMKQHVCFYCEEKFVDFRNFYIHCMSHYNCMMHNENLPYSAEDWYSCPLCPKSDKLTPCSSSLETIVQSVYKRCHKRYYVCEYCNKKCTRLVSLKSHLRMHDSTRKANRCEMCLTSFPDKYNLRKHVEFDHKAGIQYSCDVCSKPFLTEIGLKRHKKIHSDTDCVYCPFCSKKFSSQKRVIFHIRIFHPNGDDGLTCEICSKNFTTMQGCINHKKSHTTKKESFTCPYCQKILFRKQSYNGHVKRKHNNSGEKFPCDICTKSFSISHDLVRHREIHNKDIFFVCPFCQKKFSTKSNCNTHIGRVHKTIEKYKCDKCEKTFSHIDYFKVHMKIHSEEECFKCPHCQKKFSKKQHCNQHIVRMHSCYLVRRENQKPKALKIIAKK